MRCGCHPWKRAPGESSRGPPSRRQSEEAPPHTKANGSVTRSRACHTTTAQAPRDRPSDGSRATPPPRPQAGSYSPELIGCGYGPRQYWRGQRPPPTAQSLAPAPGERGAERRPEICSRIPWLAQAEPPLKAVSARWCRGQDAAREFSGGSHTNRPGDQSPQHSRRPRTGSARFMHGTYPRRYGTSLDCIGSKARWLWVPTHRAGRRRPWGMRNCQGNFTGV